MFLKSLVIRGFKSFPDKTTLVFEPGITVIVGPNGSGKSNVVDSISWVLGEQGPRSLRGGKMEDVIFAGSRLRPALGMAEVTLTIDNSAKLLPIEFEEVTISRSLFRSGESEYRLNGAVCRLLDIQEVLSDTGIGREQHTIIGQGQLDEVLEADPMQMRAFIEEAAGVAKHRRRKDRALRKIASTEQNLARVGDLLSEIRRQLRPLREQAEVARRFSVLSEELSRVRMILAAREMAEVRLRLGPAGSLDVDAPVREKEDALRALETRLTDAERARSDHFSTSEGKRDVAWSLTRSQERLSAIARLAAEREKTLQARLAGATEEAFRARIEDLTREKSQLENLVSEALAAQERAEGEASSMEDALNAANQKVAAFESELGPLRQSRREAIAEAVRVRGEIGALDNSRDAAERENARIVARRGGLAAARDEASERLQEARAEVESLERQEEPLTSSLERIETAIYETEEKLSVADAKLREIEKKVAQWRARADLRASEPTARRISSMKLPRVLGVLGDLIEVAPTYQKAIDAIAGPTRSVLLVQSYTVVKKVLDEVGDHEGVGILIASDEPVRIEGAIPVAEVIVVHTQEVALALSGVFIVDDISLGARLASEHPEYLFVTLDGAVAGGKLVSRGPADTAGVFELLERELRDSETESAAGRDELQRLRAARDAAVSKLNEADAHMAAAVERMSAIDRELHALNREIEAVAESEAQAGASASSISRRIETLRRELPDLERRIDSTEGDVQRLQEEHGHAMGAKDASAIAFEEARMTLARATERTKLLGERNRAVEAEVDSATRSAEGLQGRRHQLLGAIEEVIEIAASASALSSASGEWSEAAEAAYQEERAKVESTDELVASLRVERAAVAGALDDLRMRAREEDAARSEMRVRSRILEERIREEWAIDADKLVTRYGHVWEVEDPSAISDPLERLALLDEESIRRKRQRLERDVENVGRVNPLAGQEFEALTERESFLSGQLADIRASRRDLFKLVTSIDERIRELFLAAYEDIAREYESLFVMLFPGGQGRLRLSDPADPLMTGVEVEARPGGKNLKRLSLLSGGERALSALAVLFAIFSARPSPFYILDEVEAALDDVNLHRFLGLLMRFRERSQLLVVTHQKRTMEAADILYGISIRPDGASRVISQRMTEATPTAEDMKGRTG